jgi:hypothetical protein
VRGPILKERFVRWEREARRTGPESGTPGGAGLDREADVHVRQNGDVVEAIEVTCTCGHHIVIQCLYDETSGDLTDGKERPGQG